MLVFETSSELHSKTLFPEPQLEEVGAQALSILKLL